MDLSDITETLRGPWRVLQALATTQSEHTALLRQLGATLEQQGTTLEQHGTVLEQITGMLHRLTGELPSPN